jgi:hypothetical protein
MMNVRELLWIIVMCNSIAIASGILAIAIEILK